MARTCVWGTQDVPVWVKTGRFCRRCSFVVRMECPKRKFPSRERIKHAPNENPRRAHMQGVPQTQVLGMGVRRMCHKRKLPPYANYCHIRHTHIYMCDAAQICVTQPSRRRLLVDAVGGRERSAIKMIGHMTGMRK